MIQQEPGTGVRSALHDQQRRALWQARDCRLLLGGPQTGRAEVQQAVKHAVESTLLAYRTQPIPSQLVVNVTCHDLYAVVSEAR